MQPFAYHRPNSLQEAFDLKTATPNARFVAGGTDILVQMKKRRVLPPDALISLRGVEELARIEIDEQIRLGATAPVGEIVESPQIKEMFPAFVDALRALGSPQIRTVATLGGNLCNASPAADAAPPLMVYDAKVELRSPTGQRLLPIKDLFLSPGKTALGFDEVLTAILLDPPASGAKAVFMRKGRVRMDLAVVSLALFAELKDGLCQRARVAVGSVAPVPMRLSQVEAILERGEIGEASIAEARQVAEASVAPITDVRSTAQYRRVLTGVFVERAIKRIWPAAVRGARR